MPTHDLVDFIFSFLYLVIFILVYFALDGRNKANWALTTFISAFIASIIYCLYEGGLTEDNVDPVGAFVFMSSILIVQNSVLYCFISKVKKRVSE